MMRGLWLCAVLALPVVARAQGPAAPPPAPVAPVDSVRAPIGVRGAFHLIDRDNYLRRHAFSLDHFLEFEPGGVLARLGPIGNEAFYSRWGIGRGRALVTVNDIPVNDPQDGRAPLAHIATSGLARLDLDAPLERSFGSSIEGAIAIHELDPVPQRPHTFIELSKGTNEVKQRRVRFGSKAGPVGIDLSYDEVLDDGYDFDANDVVLDARPDGRALSRNAAAVIRGSFGDDTDYSVGLRRFRASSTGDLNSAFSEAERSGHIAWAGVGAGPVRGTVYGRGYSNERPDSSTRNETVGGVAAYDGRRGGAALHLFALGEHTNATQELGGALDDARVNTGTAGGRAQADAGGITWFADGSVAGDEKSLAWGAGGGVTRALPGGDLTLAGRRVFRLPSLGERYAPQHVSSDNLVLLSGNRGVDPETALEASAVWTLRAGAFTSHARGAWIRSQDYIAWQPLPGADPLLRLPLNADDRPAMTFVEERLGVAAMLGRFEVRGDAGGSYTTGDRTGAFRSVPRTQLNAALEVGTELFEKSSAAYFGAEYAFVDEREDYRGVLLPSYQVVNLSLVGRLIDARFYVRWLNLLDEQYQTVSGYLMTPRTLAYGIEWTLFN
ncbi:MAG TPA: hypothetical protein VF247_01485 [Candidatus Krumholzibacteria bacterium]